MHYIREKTSLFFSAQLLGKLTSLNKNIRNNSWLYSMEQNGWLECVVTADGVLTGTDH